MSGTITMSRDELYDDTRFVTLACVAAADGALDGDIADLSGLLYGPLRGWGIFSIETVPGDTPPTDASDLKIKTRLGTDILEGCGTDRVDATSGLMVYLPVTPLPVPGQAYLSIEGNSEAGATVTVVLNMARGA